MCHCCTAPRPIYVTLCVYIWVIHLIGRVTHMNESCHLYKWLMACVTAARRRAQYMWHVSFICVTRPTHMCDVAHSYVWHRSIIYMWHDSFICVAWQMYMCDTSQSYMWHDSFICVTRLSWGMYMCDVTLTGSAEVRKVCQTRWVDSFTCTTWLIHMCDTTHPYMWHDSIIHVTWLIHTYDMAYSYTWRHFFKYVTWLIHIGDMSHSHVWHDSHICVWHDSCVWRDSFICDINDLNVWHGSYTCVPWTCRPPYSFFFMPHHK